MNSSMNYYELLGVSEKASKEEIKKAYKEQMKKWHPDINKSKEAPEMSIKINEAKEILLDDEKRKVYDLSLNQEINNNYQKYNYQGQDNHKASRVYEEAKKVTKWEYFREYLKYGQVSKWRKVLATIGVVLESFLCFIIKIILIGVSLISNLCSYLIMMSFSLLAPILGLLLIILIITIVTEGLGAALTNSAISSGLLVFILLYVLMIVLPILSRKIISPKVFDILYNKIDINLFKKCVGYKN